MSKLFDVFPVELKETVFEFRASKLKNCSKNNRLHNNKSTTYAYPTVNKLPLGAKKQIISAINQFDNVKKVSDEDKQVAFKKILQAAEIYGICTMVFKERYAKYQQEH